MNSLIITINGIPYTCKENNFISYNIGQEFDNAVVIVEADTKIAYERFEPTTLSINNGLKTFDLIISSITYEKAKTKWINTISAVEITTILNYFIINGMAITNGANLYEQISNAITKINYTLTSQKLILNASQNWSIFSNASSENFIFSEECTVREILDEMMSPLKCEVRITKYEKVSGIPTLTVSFENLSTKLADMSNELTSAFRIKEYVKEENVVNGIKGIVKSGFGIDDIQTPYANLRSLEIGKFINTEALYLTSFPIEQIYNVYAECSVDKYILSGETWVFVSTGTSPIGNELMITDFVVEKEYYDLLTDEERQYLLYFERNKQNIKGFYDTLSKWGFTSYHISNLKTYLINEEIAVYYEGIYKYVFNIFTTDPTNLKLKVKYKPSGDAYYNELKDTSISTYSGSTNIINNSSGRNVDINRYGAFLQNTINRVGNSEIEFDVRYTSPTSISNIKDFIGDYICDKISLSIYNSYINVNYHLTKNYLPTNEKIDIKKETRTYDIPVDGYVDRYLEYNVIASTFTDAIGVMVKTYKTLNEEIMTDWVYMPLKKYHSTNTNYAIAEFVDNQGIDYYKSLKTVNGTTANVVQKYAYADENGECSHISIMLVGQDYLDTDYVIETYPIEPFVTYDNVIYTNLKRTISKDKYEKLILVFVNRV